MGDGAAGGVGEVEEGVVGEGDDGGCIESGGAIADVEVVLVGEGVGELEVDAGGNSR